jgi:peptidoglycan/xylan/chitin deacetylase (PgdA/CDA1 family)
VRRRRADVLVLCYHGVRPRSTTPREVPVEALRRQVQSLLDRGYRGATFTQAVSCPPRRRTLALTFDDGERVVATHARPLLDRLGVPATLFVSSDLVGGHDLLTWDELRVLSEAGWEIGAHGRTHVELPALGVEELRAELAEPRERIAAELGRPCTSLAYPFGAADERVLAAAAEAGYEAGALLAGRVRPGRPLAWPRVGIGAADGPLSFRVKTAPAVRAARASRAAAPVEEAVRLLRSSSGKGRGARPG